METNEWFGWITDTPQGQFLFGVGVLIFGSKAVLSEKFWEGRISAFGALARWGRRRQMQAAEREIESEKAMRLELEVKHDYIVAVTEYLRKIDVKAAQDGWELPQPKLSTYLLYEEAAKKRVKEDEDDG